MTAHRHVFAVHRHGPIRGHRLGWERLHAHVWWRHDHPKGVGERGWRHIKAAVLALAALSLCGLTLGPIPTEPEPLPTVYASPSIPQPYDMEAERHALYEAAEKNTARKAAARVGVARRQVASASRAAHRRTHGGAVWDRLADCESGDWRVAGSANWQANTGNGYQGGLQWHPRTWAAVKPADAPANAADASREQQIAAAENLMRKPWGGWHHWPACSRKLGLRP